MADSNNIGDNVRRERIQHGLTQEQLAELSDLSLNFISKIERLDNTNISVNSLNAIANGLGISTYELLEGTNKGNPSKRRKKVDLLSRQLYKLDPDLADELCDSFLKVIRIVKRESN